MHERMQGNQFLFIATVFYGSLFIVTILLFRLLRMSLAAHIHWWYPRIARDIGIAVAATIPLLAFFLYLCRSHVAALRQIQTFLDEHITPAVSDLSIATLAVLCIGVGISEELLFRGLIQIGFADIMNSAAALIIASAIFGLAHFITPIYGLIATVIGGYLGLMFLLTDNLITAIVTHALYDFIALRHLVHQYRNKQGCADGASAAEM